MINVIIIKEIRLYIDQEILRMLTFNVNQIFLSAIQCDRDLNNI